MGLRQRLTGGGSETDGLGANSVGLREELTSERCGGRNEAEVLIGGLVSQMLTGGPNGWPVSQMLTGRLTGGPVSQMLTGADRGPGRGDECKVEEKGHAKEKRDRWARRTR